MLAPSAAWLLRKVEFEPAGVRIRASWEMTPSPRWEGDAAAVPFRYSTRIVGRSDYFGLPLFEDAAKEQVILNTNPDFFFTGIEKRVFPPGNCDWQWDV